MERCKATIEVDLVMWIPSSLEYYAGGKRWVSHLTVHSSFMLSNRMIHVYDVFYDLGNPLFGFVCLL